MAKLDANGRTIYETAEEYNQAHSTGTARRTYDSPEGDNYRHTTYKETKSYERAARKVKGVTTGTAKNKKNTKKVLIIGLAVFMVINIVVVVLMFNMVRGTVEGVYESYEDDYIEDNHDWEDDDDNGGYGEYMGDSDAPLPEGFETFSYNGTTYSLPMTFDDFTQMGFALEETYDGETILEAEGYEHLIINGVDGYMVGIMRIRNTTEEEQPLRECTIDYFSIDNQAAYDEEMEVIDFIFGNDLTMNSTYEEVEAIFGTPYYQYISDDEYGCYESYEWLYSDGSEYHCVMIGFWNGVITNVSIENSEY